MLTIKTELLQILQLNLRQKFLHTWEGSIIDSPQNSYWKQIYFILDAIRDL